MSEQNAARALERLGVKVKKSQVVPTLQGQIESFLRKAKDASIQDRLEEHLLPTLDGLSEDEILTKLSGSAFTIQYEETAQQMLVRHLRSMGVPWSRIGDAVGTTRQGAWQRYGYLEE